MRVLLLSSNHQDHRVAGPQKVGVTLAAELAARGHAVSLLTNRPGERAERWTDERGVEVLALPGEATVGTYARHAGRIRAFLRERRPGVVHGNGVASAPLAAAMARLAGGARAVQTVYDVLDAWKPMGRRRLAGLRLARRVLTSSAYCARVLAAGGVDASRVSVVPYGIERRWFDPPEHGPGRGALFWGDACWDRGFDALLDAARALAADGVPVDLAIRRYYPGYREKVDAAVARAPGLRVHADADIRRVVWDAGVVLLPYLATTMQPPLTLVESMLSEKAVVTTDVEANAELAEDGKTAVLVPPGDAGALADAARGLLADAGRRRALGQAARERARRAYDWDAAITAVLRAYGEA